MPTRVTEQSYSSTPASRWLSPLPTARRTPSPISGGGPSKSWDSGHAAFETFSVPAAAIARARARRVVARVLRTNFPATLFLSAEHSGRLLAQLDQAGIAGGSVYDALVGAVAAEHDVRLATRDRRALDTYRALGVDIELISDE